MSAPRSLPAALKPYVSKAGPGAAFGVKRKVNGIVTSTHNGFDFPTPTGLPLESGITGRISLAGGSMTHQWGYYVHVICDCPLKHVEEFHILRDKPQWKVGDEVEAGDLIGYTGKSGSLNGQPYASHHHHGTSVGGKYYDPLSIGWPDGASNGSTPLENDDMTPLEFLQTRIELVPGKPETARTVEQALRAIFTETQATIQRVDTARSQITDVATAVWAHPLKHPLANRAVSAGDLLRYEPAEHENTRRAVALVASGDLDAEEIAKEIAGKFPGLDPHAYAVAAADEADRREREALKNRAAS